MRFASWALTGAATLMIGSCAGGRAAGSDDVLRLSRPAPARDRPVPDDAELAREARLDAIVAVVLARNPGLAEGEARVEAGLERAGAAGGLPDPELLLEVEHVPLARPYMVGDADAFMASIRQTIPAPGSRSARERAAVAGARASAWELAARRRDLVREAARAFADYSAATAEITLHEEHVSLGHGLVDALRAGYRGGRASQQDVLLAELEANRLHTTLIDARQRQASMRALLNGLMGRPPDAPLGPPPAPAAETVDLEIDRLVALQRDHRPELGGAAAEVQRAEAERQAAGRERSRPDLMLEAGYMAMPEAEHVHGYRVMVGIGLPWFSGRRAAEVRAADRELQAARRAEDAAAINARTELADAVARVTAARESYDLIEATLLPAADRGYQSALAGFIAPQGSAVTLLTAFRMRIDLRVERVRALARLSASIADLERIVGTELPRRTP